MERSRTALNGPGMLDVVSLAERLGVTEQFVRRLVHERRIPFYKIGARSASTRPMLTLVLQ